MLPKFSPKNFKLFSPNPPNFPKFLPNRKYTSALYIPGRKASETFSYLTPYLDYTKTFSQVDKLQRNLRLRGINVNAEEIKSTWDFYQTIEADRKTVEDRRSSVAHRIKKLSKLKLPGSDEERELNGLMTQGKVLRQELRLIKEILWDLEETVIPRVLQLPNELHEKTPESSELVLKTVGSKNIQKPVDGAPQNHVEIGKSLGLLEYLNPFHFYLCDEAALFEVAVQTYASKILNSEGILRVAGTDFARSLLVEAAGMDHEDPFSTFILKNEGIDEKSVNRLHLIGGASLISFLAMHTKQLVNPKHFPLRYFATGRSYTPAVEKPMDLGLFGVCQTSAVHCMTMVREADSQEYEEEFQKLVDAISKIYDGLGVHYRVVLRSAGKLEIAECSRVAFELWSNYYADYVEVGHVSMYGDYLSKRLLIAYQTPTGRGHPAIISGTIMNVNKVLACLLEENAERFEVPEGVREFMPVGSV
ncbi:serine--tRNA synthetase-like protein Slimp [Diachasma alloeum]|uniref:serine--tRNA synthetase-like protein Slimp n=1 Tax=Diachasma alloeum TaxID=454923 RepID=UPI0007384C96|nr:serine--tRNA synthetase-like protein Slimp [Diachasma alloeum]